MAVETPELSVVMPCLNEAETLAVCVTKAFAAMRSAGIDGEVIVADNGSTDGSQRIAADHGARVVDVPVRGYGAALTAGIRASAAPYIVMGDADDSYEFGHVGRFLTKLREGSDLVMGNRFQGGIGPGAMPFLHRYLGNPALSLTGRIFFGAPVGDFHCGMRGFSRAAFERMQVRTTGMEFASEMVVKATMLKMKIAEVPTTLKKDGRSRPPHLKTWRDGWRHLRFMLLYSPRWLFLIPGLMAIVVGVVVTAALIPGPLMIGSFQLDVDTMTYALMLILIGVHAVFFSISAKIFGMSEGLLPADEGFERWFRYVTLESGLMVGILLLLVGLGGTLSAVLGWKAAGFGQLSPTRALRVTLPSAFAIALGAEITLSSFFLSMLGLRRR